MTRLSPEVRGLVVDLLESRLLEHPGHASQLVHGNRHGRLGAARLGDTEPQPEEATGLATLRDGSTVLAYDRLFAALNEQYDADRIAKVRAATGIAREMLNPAILDQMCGDPKVIAWNPFGKDPVAGPGEVVEVNPPNTCLTFASTGAELTGASVTYAAARWPGMTPAERREALANEPFRYALASGYIAQWAHTAGDADPTSLAVQLAAGRQFGLPGPLAGNLGSSGSHSPETALRLAQRTVELEGGFLGGLAQATYNNTQSFLSKQGIATLTVSRGLNNMSLENTIRATGSASTDRLVTQFTLSPLAVTGHPLQSWSIERGVPSSFGGAVLTAKVSAKRVFGVPGAGTGCLEEDEVVLLGGSMSVSGTTI